MKWLIINDYRVRVWVVLLAIWETFIVVGLITMWIEYANGVESLPGTIAGTVFLLIGGIGVPAEYRKDVSPYRFKDVKK
ncbi:hypothetical protein LCGC14_0579720 [marine sediment metagenome]|uniref:Uncharacterized protein n=1 Tax=marine sediment metagenome TaxID=412755 RepID=A0A0F9RGN8_9ZZZZ